MNVIYIKKKRFNRGLILPPFNPLASPNTVALWDGDGTLDPTSWVDSVNSYVIDFFNLPTYNAAGLNGHGTILFNGVNQYGNSTTPVISTPITIYLVFKQINWNNINIIFADGLDLAPSISIQQNNVSPKIRVYDADSNFTTRLDLTLNTWAVVTIQSDTNIYNLRINLGIAATGTGVNQTKNGCTLARYPTSTGFVNCEFAYIIMRDVADSTAVQNNFINWLKNRFAI